MTGEGKTAIVTGANNGFGYGLTLLLLEKGYEVIMACRDLKKGDEAITSLSAAASKFPTAGKATLMKLDLSDLNSVKSFAQEDED